jgi:antitoxin ParD1/3/4
MDITLKSDQVEFVQTQVTQGRYANAEEVVSRALKLLQDWEQDYALWLEDARQKVEIGLRQIEQGDVFDLDTVTERLRDKVLQAKQRDL